MDDAGWVTGEAIAQDGRPDKKVYRVSTAGRAELARWIAEPTEPGHLRNELAVKIRGASYGDPGRCSPRCAGTATSTPRAWTCTPHRRPRLPRVPPRSGRALHQFLVLRGGIRVEQGFVDWCDEVLAALGSEADSEQP